MQVPALPDRGRSAEPDPDRGWTSARPPPTMVWVEAPPDGATARVASGASGTEDLRLSEGQR